MDGLKIKDLRLNTYGKHLILASVQIFLILVLFYGFQYWAFDLTKLWNIGLMSEKEETLPAQKAETSAASLSAGEKERLLIAAAAKKAVPGIDEIAPSFHLQGHEPEWQRVENQFEDI
jgi:hypothetical protein